MILLKAKANNFGSYKEIEFDYQYKGLTLIYGPTGSGKSTLQDLALWTAFGITAKDGNADEIRPWYSKDLPTKGMLEVKVKDGTYITIHRTRSSSNDLYWLENDSETKVRGKDLTETQKLLEKRLGVSKELYLLAGCYNEFSPTSNFFINKAKDKRELFEKLAVLDLPVLLSERASNERKITKKELEETNRTYAKIEGHREQLQSSIKSIHSSIDNWRVKQSNYVQELKVKSEYFEKEKEQKILIAVTKRDKFENDKGIEIDKLMNRIDQLDKKMSTLGPSVCSECKQENKEVNALTVKRTLLISEIKHLNDKANPYESEILTAESLHNSYSGLLVIETDRANPFVFQLTDLNKQNEAINTKIDTTKKECQVLENKLIALNQLYDLSFNLRGELLKKAIKDIENETNRILETYFEGSLRVGFTFEQSDDLDVKIWKNGYECVYKQLSKGQRSLLKLSFSLSVMKASMNKAGVHFNTLSFDEALDGLDTELKLKAFKLFEELSLQHETILVIDHSEELKNLFFNKYCVTINSEVSTLNEES